MNKHYYKVFDDVRMDGESYRAIYIINYRVRSIHYANYITYVSILCNYQIKIVGNTLTHLVVIL